MNNLGFIYPHIKPYRFHMVGFMLFSFISTFFSVVSLAMIVPFLQILFEQVQPPLLLPTWDWSLPSLLQTLYYYAGQHFGAHNKFSLLLGICVVVVILFFLKNAFIYGSMHMLSPLRTGVIFSLRRDFFHHLTELPLGYFTEQRKGDLMSRISNDVLEVEWTIMNSMVSLFRDPLTLLAFLIAMFWFNFKLSLFALILLPVSALIIGRVGSRLRKSSIQSQGILSDMNVMAEETLGGMRVIKGFTAESQRINRFNESNQIFFELGNKIFRKRSLSTPLSEFLGSIVIAVVMWFGGRLVLSGEMEAGAFIAYIAMFSQIIPPAKSVSSTWYNIQKGRASLERIREIMDVKPTIDEGLGRIEEVDFVNEIRFDKVCFSYGEGPVLKSISGVIPKGKTIALVGSSGAGKSTLMDLLPRFYEIQSGQILFDGHSLTDYSPRSLRKRMGMVPQQPILFNDSVLANITLGDEHPDAERAKKAAELALAHDFIIALPKGYNTPLGDAGVRLSGGQRQRIAIARALYKNPPILLLDEATSALDSENEQLVQVAFSNLMQNRTVLVIAHRLSTILHADCIWVMDEGEIIQRGTHEELMIQGGRYEQLYRAQFKSENTLRQN
jgi:subfamily B ATP-binding cassette protein MsbA